MESIVDHLHAQVVLPYLLQCLSPSCSRDVQRSFYDYENNQQDALYRLIYYSKSVLRVLGDVFAHHQEHLTVFTVSGSVLVVFTQVAAGWCLE